VAKEMKYGSRMAHYDKDGNWRSKRESDKELKTDGKCETDTTIPVEVLENENAQTSMKGFFFFCSTIFFPSANSFSETSFFFMSDCFSLNVLLI
jgi:hypothetical protein